MRIKYTNMKFNAARTERIVQANEIIAQYAEQGFVLTLRQLYYQFVARTLIANNDREYKKLGDVVADGRLAGLIDWEAITDRTRFVRDLSHWNDPPEIIDTCAKQFRLPKWQRQPYYVECFIEKDALIGVIEGVCEELDLPYLACRGYASASEIWRAGHHRFRTRLRNDKKCVVLYLGDHDPSGLDMTRDIRERLALFVGDAGGDVEWPVDVRRLALNMDQIEEYGPPPNPTKMTDTRATWYVQQYGATCWELDALEPAVIAQLIRDAVMELRDEDLWQEAVDEEAQHRSHLAAVSKNWDTVVESLPEDEE